ncbi:MAG TPA: helix-turn-helix domain-containing protein [Patescibacteria group bacterium]|nr:helix-turn-helix domain-containing protein [Patescibacteria group bacterium]
MEIGTSEIAYPLTFRRQEAQALGEHLHHRHSVDLVGMKRVGISNFLRYFLYHPQVKPAFISKDEKHLFIRVDLNDLVERELYAFWMLTFKRIIDEVERSHLPTSIQQKVAGTFLSSIQTNDLFLLIDAIRRSLTLIVLEGFYPTIFFLRFDRIKDVVTPEFFDNLQGLRDGSHGKLAYVFTSYRSLDALSPKALPKADLSAFYHTMFIRPSQDLDMQVIADSYKSRYALQFSSAIEKELFTLVGGNVQYLQLALIVLKEHKDVPLKTKEQLATLLLQDERINLYSEELWESLTTSEKHAIGNIYQGIELSEEEEKAAEYIFQTGFISKDKKAMMLFSPLFAHYVKHALEHVGKKEKELVFSKKEHLLFSLLKEKVGQICERDTIIEAVWPEYVEFGVSDWSIDRLVARVRGKLKKQASPYEIRTIRTRGYMLTERV